MGRERRKRCGVRDGEGEEEEMWGEGEEEEMWGEGWGGRGGRDVIVLVLCRVQREESECHELQWPAAEEGDER